MSFEQCLGGWDGIDLGRENSKYRKSEVWKDASCGEIQVVLSMSVSVCEMMLVPDFVCEFVCLDIFVHCGRRWNLVRLLVWLIEIVLRTSEQSFSYGVPWIVYQCTREQDSNSLAYGIRAYWSSQDGFFWAWLLGLSQCSQKLFSLVPSWEKDWFRGSKC